MKNQLVFSSTDLRIIPEVMSMIEKSKVKGINTSEMEKFIKDSIGKPDTKILILFDGEKIQGFMLAYIVMNMNTPEVFIAWTYVDPKNKPGCKMLLTTVENWARSLGITKISAYVRKNVEAFQTKYGFSLDYYGVSKNLEENK